MNSGMGTDYTLEFNVSYIHVIHPPDYEITPKGLEKLYQELAEICRTYNCNKVLAEGTHMKRRMDSTDAIESGFQALKAIPGLKLAICSHAYVPDRTTQLYIDIAHNRGAQIAFFREKEKALAWLGA